MAVYRTGFDTCPIDNTPLTTLSVDPLIGTTIADQYAIDSCVGEGAMGRVYLAHHVRLTKRRFAIKVLLGDLAADPTMRQRFGQEAEAASRLQHPNVVSVLDFGKTDSGLHYLVMDFIEGGSLCDRVDAGALSELETIELTKQICLGLTHAHEQGLVHRDFKPDNVALVEHDGKTVPKILDFGLAIISTPEESSVRLTTAGLVVGTPAYISPEQSQGHPVDLRTDLFALGVSIYEMLAGMLPFSGSVIDVLYKNATAPAPPIAERAGLAVSPQLEAVITKLMAKDPAERFSSAREVLAALEAIEAPRAAVAHASAETSTSEQSTRKQIETAQTMTAVAQLATDEGSLGEAAADATNAAPQNAVAKSPEKGGLRWARPAMLATALVGVAAAAFLVLGNDKTADENSKTAKLTPALIVVDAGTKALTQPALTPPPDASTAVVAIADADASVESAREPQRDKPRRDRNRLPRNPTPKRAKEPPAPEPTPELVMQPKPEQKPDPAVPKPKPKPELVVQPKPKPRPPVVQPPKPTVFKAKTAIGSFASDGSLSDSKVRRPIKTSMPKFAGCYEKAAKASQKNMKLRVKVKYFLNENGRAERVSVSSTPLSGLASCIDKAVKKLRTRDHPDTGAQPVSFTLTYEPKQ